MTILRTEGYMKVLFKVATEGENRALNVLQGGHTGSSCHFLGKFIKEITGLSTSEVSMIDL